MHMKNRKSFLRGILDGMAPPSPFEPIRLPTLDGSDSSRMRGDVERVGKQFFAVIERENEEANPTRPEAKRR
jgi:hypothetical protein